MTGSIRVLYVDDDVDFAEMTADALEGEDGRFVVETATSASEGLDRLEEVDCVVSEYDMPHTDGVEFLEAVREDRPDLPFVLFIGDESEAVAGEAVSAGVTGYLRKTGGPEQYRLLADRIVDAVERWRADRNRREALKQVPGGVAIHDPDDGSLLDADAEFARLFGYERDELIDAGGIRPDELPYTADRVGERIRRVADGGRETFEWPGVTKDGEEIRVELHVDSARLDGEERLLAIVRDVTDRAERERRLREESRLLDAVFEHVPTHLYVKDREARLVRLSEFYVDDAGERIGKTDREIAPGEFGEAAYADDMSVIETGEPIINEEEYFPSRDRWALTSKAPWYDEEGEVAGLVGATRVITERKEYEQELERQNERLERFASVLSHDLRNPLNAAAGRLELAREDCDSDHLDGAAEALDRMEALIEDVLTLARRGRRVGETEPVDLPDVVEGCWLNVETGTARLAVGTDRTIRADRSRLRQLFENLIRNAIEHGGEDVTVEVGDLPGGFYIADDGPGIPPGKRDRVLEAGYSTAEEGTGFGLSIVNEIAQAHGWTVDVTESEAGGARFEITGAEAA